MKNLEIAFTVIKLVKELLGSFYEKTIELTFSLVELTTFQALVEVTLLR